MSHYAKIENNIVTQVIVADYDFVSKLDGEWVRTSYNTHANVHSRGDIPLRKNFAGVGYSYDRALDSFIPPKPFPSWELNIDTGQWESKIKPPEDLAAWNETLNEWELI